MWAFYFFRFQSFDFYFFRFIFFGSVGLISTCLGVFVFCLLCSLDRLDCLGWICLGISYWVSWDGIVWVVWDSLFGTCLLGDFSCWIGVRMLTAWVVSLRHPLNVFHVFNSRSRRPFGAYSGQGAMWRQVAGKGLATAEANRTGLLKMVWV